MSDNRLRDVYNDVLDSSDASIPDRLRAADALREMGDGDPVDEAAVDRARAVSRMSGVELVEHLADLLRPSASADSSMPGPATRATSLGEVAAAHIEDLERDRRELRAELRRVSDERDRLAGQLAALRQEGDDARELPGGAARLELPAPPSVR